MGCAAFLLGSAKSVNILDCRRACDSCQAFRVLANFGICLARPQRIELVRRSPKRPFASARSLRATAFYPYRGGYENSMLAIARCLVNRGHRVTVFTTIADDLESLWVPGYKTFPREEFVIDGVSVRRFPICYKRLRRRATRIAGALPNWRLKAQYWTPGFRVPGLDAALRNSNADIFHVGPLPYNNLMYAGLRAGEFRGAAGDRHSMRASGRGQER